ncbi:MAG: hypothetical protein EOP22_06185 [Hyphomicrobiales bacterium]|nr:MAG: hypothetical protein EOP22_06185 [Hyphomicrobiales bacterium]
MTAQQIALWGTVGVYGLVALLLVSLNIFSLWRWWIKAAAIVLTGVMFLSAYSVISGLIGWPSDARLPTRFSLLHTYVEEPNKLSGDPGHIYLWVQELDAQQVPIAAPRAYVMPFVVETMKGVTQSQEMLDRGEAVLGESTEQVVQSSGKPGEEATSSDNKYAETGGINLSLGGTPTDKGAGSIFGFPGGQTVNFSPMPPPPMPQKAAIPQG